MIFFCHFCRESFRPVEVHFNSRYGYSFAHCPKCSSKIEEPREKFNPRKPLPELVTKIWFIVVLGSLAAMAITYVLEALR